MPRGGRRNGSPAKAGQYSNRSDLRGTPQYGDAKALADQAAALPTAAQQPSPAQQAAQQVQRAPGVLNGLGALDRPTDRPGEPVTAGAPMGPGPGMEALGVNQISDDTVARLQVIYQQFPSEGLRQLLETLEEEV